MVGMTGGDLNLLWARRLVAGLAEAGVERVVISPGSRSTPLALAAATHPRLGCSLIVDERSAAFFALGQARATGRPSVLVCTSGTAGAHYLPAVMEAAAANVPLIAITADRPPELHGRGALQTVEQARLFGPHLRAFFELGPPAGDERALRGVQATAALAVARSLDPQPGPVHLNAPFRPPLEPSTLVETAPAEPPPVFFPPRRAPSAAAVAALAAACRKSRRGVIVAGPAPLWAAGTLPLAVALSRRLGFPLLAEAASQMRFAGAAEVLGLFEMLAPPGGGADLCPDFVLQLGAYPTSTAWGRWLDGDGAAERWVVTPHGWADPADRAAGVVAGEEELVLAALFDALGRGEPAEPEWASRWARAEAVVREVVTEAEARDRVAGWLSEASTVRAALRAAPEGALLAVGNSLAIREVDLACPPEMARVGVLAQRGVSGIDGAVSAAAGAASVTARPVVAILGDLALLHDVGGLAACRHARGALVLVVLANRGGRVFELLPLGDGRLDEETVSSLFIADQGAEVAHLAAGFGVRHVRVTGASDVEAAVASACRDGGSWVVEAVISGPGVRERRAALREAVLARMTAGAA